MTTMPLHKDWKAVACTACRNLDKQGRTGDYCKAWERQVGAPLDQPVRMCKHYEPK